MSKFSIKDRLLSFSYAFNGLKILIKDEHNAWIHLATALCTIAAGFYFDISNAEWLAIVISIFSVFTAEIFNTAIEHIANFVQPNKDDKIKAIKDLAAAGVFVTAAGSLVVGLIIFLPRLLHLLD